MDSCCESVIKNIILLMYELKKESTLYVEGCYESIIFIANVMNSPYKFMYEYEKNRVIWYT